MKNPKDYDAKIDGGEVWNLLDQSTETEVSPAFTQNVLRAARMAAPENKSWISSFMNPAVISAGVAVVLITAVFTFKSFQAESDVGSIPVAETEEVENLWYAEALLNTALENPELFSDEDLVAMVF